MDNTINNMFISAIGAKPAHTIVAVSGDGREIKFAASNWLFADLCNDKTVAAIYDGETGEILFDR